MILVTFFLKVTGKLLPNLQEYFLEDVFKFTDYLKEDCLRKNLNTSEFQAQNSNINIKNRSFISIVKKRSNGCEASG